MISQLTNTQRLALERRFQRALHGASSLETAAQRYCEVVYEALADSLALLRVFATQRFEDLPEPNRRFVRAQVGARAVIHGETLVLSLIGSMGVEPAWCDRRRSEHHIGIPLISREFVAETPMVSRMLKQLGVELDWLGRDEAAIVGKTFGFQSGVFYVANAATAVDAAGRKIIPAQGFVDSHGVQTVYGVGGGYVGTPVYAAIIGFCREQVDEQAIEALRSHIDRFKAETGGLVQAGRIFADGV